MTYFSENVKPKKSRPGQPLGKLVFVGLTPNYLSLRDQSADWSWQSPNNSGRFVRAFVRFSDISEYPGDCHVASLLAMTAFSRCAKYQFATLSQWRQFSRIPLLSLYIVIFLLFCIPHLVFRQISRERSAMMIPNFRDTGGSLPRWHRPPVCRKITPGASPPSPQAAHPEPIQPGVVQPLRPRRR